MTSLHDKLLSWYRQTATGIEKNTFHLQKALIYVLLCLKRLSSYELHQFNCGDVRYISYCGCNWCSAKHLVSSVPQFKRWVYPLHPWGQAWMGRLGSSMLLVVWGNTAVNKDLGRQHNKRSIWPNQQSSSLFSCGSKVILCAIVAESIPCIETRLQDNHLKRGSDVWKPLGSNADTTTSSFAGWKNN